VSSAWTAVGIGYRTTYKMWRPGGCLIQNSTADKRTAEELYRRLGSRVGFTRRSS
jgi:hypothetical protein